MCFRYFLEECFGRNSTRFVVNRKSVHHQADDDDVELTSKALFVHTYYGSKEDVGHGGGVWNISGGIARYNITDTKYKTCGHHDTVEECSLEFINKRLDVGLFGVY